MKTFAQSSRYNFLFWQAVSVFSSNQGVPFDHVFSPLPSWSKFFQVIFHKYPAALRVWDTETPLPGWWCSHSTDGLQPVCHTRKHNHEYNVFNYRRVLFGLCNSSHCGYATCLFQTELLWLRMQNVVISPQQQDLTKPWIHDRIILKYLTIRSLINYLYPTYLHAECNKST